MYVSPHVSKGKLYPGTLVHRVKQQGQSSVLSAIRKTVPRSADTVMPEDGVIDSLKYLLCHEYYVKPFSDEYVLATLLTMAF